MQTRLLSDDYYCRLLEKIRDDHINGLQYFHDGLAPFFDTSNKQVFQWKRHESNDFRMIPDEKCASCIAQLNKSHGANANGPVPVPIKPKKKQSFLSSCATWWNQISDEAHEKKKAQAIEAMRRDQVEINYIRERVKILNGEYSEPPTIQGYSSHNPATYEESEAYFRRYAHEHKFGYSSSNDRMYASSLPGWQGSSYWLTLDQAMKLAEDLRKKLYTAEYTPSLRKYSRW